MARRLIAYDPDLKRPGCVILAAAMGTDLQLPQLFPVESWLLAPTPGMLRLPIDSDEQLQALVRITEEAM